MQKRTIWRALIAVAAGTLITAGSALAQLHFKAGSIPDLAFELIFFAGKLFASLFHDRGTASPEFLWRSWLFTGLVFSGLVYSLTPTIREAAY